MNPDQEVEVFKSIRVRAPQSRAFEVWTAGVNGWWPRSHTRSQNPESEIQIEGQNGGRIFERSPAGEEWDWGRVILWDPPHRLVYHWYLGSGAELPSEVEVTFRGLDEETTLVEVRHRGPEALGNLWWERKHLFHKGWDTVLPLFDKALQS